MMKTILLEGSKMTTKVLSHLYFKESFDFPYYYGENLDALWDMLTSIGEPTEIKLVDGHLLFENMDVYGGKIIEVFNDAQESNPNIVFIVET